MSTLLELTELDEIVPTPSMSFMLSVNFASISVLFIIVVFEVLVVVVVFVTLYPFAVKAFFTSVNVDVEPEPFNISIFIFEASVLLTSLFEVLLDDVLFVLVLLVVVFPVVKLLVDVFPVVFVESSLVSLSPEPYNSSINFAVSFLSATKNHNGYDGVVDGP